LIIASTLRPASDSGVSPEANNAAASLFAEKMTALETLSKTYAEGANQQRQADLTRKYGQQTDAAITNTMQDVQLMAEQVGVSTEALNAVGATLSAKMGDAKLIRFMAPIADAMGKDSAVDLHEGCGLTMTPAGARAELARFEATDG
jgi:NACalpha-BTF3-like transcription factor